MRVTQGTFSFLPDLTDEQIEAQIRYALSHGWAMSIEYTDDPHPRNTLWELWGLPTFNTGPEDFENVMREVRAAREAFPEHYIKLIAYAPTYTRQTTALAFIVVAVCFLGAFMLVWRVGLERLLERRRH